MTTPIHLIVRGRPVSCQSRRDAVRAWKEKVASVARSKVSRPAMGNDLAVTITYFYRLQPRFDTDNFSKPICDALSRIVYHDDRQIAERIVRRVPLSRPLFLGGMPPELAVALCAGDELVYIRIDQSSAPRTLPLRTQMALAWC